MSDATSPTSAAPQTFDALPLTPEVRKAIDACGECDFGVFAKVHVRHDLKSARMRCLHDGRCFGGA